jgi:hypothetical protein
VAQAGRLRVANFVAALLAEALNVNNRAAAAAGGAWRVPAVLQGLMQVREVV